MTYYEELGLTASASAEDIRKAHRTLSRLLHPDQQTDETLRRAAELQMRRVNAIIDVLLDASKRRQYDQSLRPPLPPEPLDPDRQAAPFSILKLLGIVATAIAATLIAIWMLGGDFIHGKGAAVTYQPALHEVSRAAGIPASDPRPVLPGPAPVPPLLPRQEMLRETRSAPPDLLLRRLTMNGPRYLPDGLLPALTTAYNPPSIPLPQPSPEVWRPPPPPSFAGLWLLPSPHQSAAQRGQAPHYVQMNIHRGQNEAIYGEYSARYEAPDRPVSPEVAFKFSGSATGTAAVLDWRAADGSHGNIELKLLTSHSMQVTWQATSFGSSLAIAGGAAVLVKPVN